MAALLDVQPGQLVYDPSTGGGMLLYAVSQVWDDRPGPSPKLHAREINFCHWMNSPVLEPADRDRILFTPGDCLQEFELKADRVIMNSPFAQGAAFDHIAHVYNNNLKAGGVLVSFVDAVAIGNHYNPKVRRFHRLLSQDAAYSQVIYTAMADQADTANCDKPGAVLLLQKP